MFTCAWNTDSLMVSVCKYIIRSYMLEFSVHLCNYVYEDVIHMSATIFQTCFEFTMRNMMVA